MRAVSVATGIPAYEIRPDTWIPPSRAAATGRADLAETMGRKFTAADSGAAFRRQQSRSTIVSMRSTEVRMRWVPSNPHDVVLSCITPLAELIEQRASGEHLAIPGAHRVLVRQGGRAKLLTAFDAPINGDGKADILWQDDGADGGTPAIWEMNGTSIIGAATAGPGLPTWHVAGTGDFNGNGKATFSGRPMTARSLRFGR